LKKKMKVEEDEQADHRRIAGAGAEDFLNVF
jgi:hypothetical protein